MAHSRSMWYNRDVYIEPVFIQLISPKYSSVVGPSCFLNHIIFNDLTSDSDVRDTGQE